MNGNTVNDKLDDLVDVLDNLLKELRRIASSMATIADAFEDENVSCRSCTHFVTCTTKEGGSPIVRCSHYVRVMDPLPVEDE